jgi:hypothetical protein
MRKNKAELEISQMQVTLADFLGLYNKNIPIGFPRASAAKLKEFQNAHPALFKNRNMWSVDRHRKKFMDWLSSRGNN